MSSLKTTDSSNRGGGGGGGGGGRPTAKSFIITRKSNPELRKTGLSNGADRPASAGHGANNNHNGDSSRPNTSSGAETTTALPQQRYHHHHHHHHHQQTRKQPKKIPSTPRILGGKSTSSVNSMPLNVSCKDSGGGGGGGSIPLSPRTSGVRKWFGGLGVPLKKARSLKDLRKLEAEKAKEMAMPPPLPGTAV
ncbi:uncharacterized protein IWZ02DRAFT_464843 [Phyllosticta citriasiana]|uniref:uncharacterized protein n=1 Tax=Phyllosticta citriasiana TaxID=595635 RepID=UPI0030FDB9FA